MPEPIPTRGEVWRVDLDPTVGSEMRKVRPCLVISSPAFDHLPIRIVAPFTSWQERFSHQPNRVHVPASGDNGMTGDSAVDPLQVRAVSVERFLARLGVLDSEQVQEVAARIAQVIEYATPS